MFNNLIHKFYSRNVSLSHQLQGDTRAPTPLLISASDYKIGTSDVSWGNKITKLNACYHKVQAKVKVNTAIVKKSLIH